MVFLHRVDCRSTTLQIVAFNPEYYIFPYSYYNTTKEGLKIEMLYRKVGSHVWNTAFNTEPKPVVLLDIRPNTEVSVCNLALLLFLLLLLLLLVVVVIVVLCCYHFYCCYFYYCGLLRLLVLVLVFVLVLVLVLVLVILFARKHFFCILLTGGR